jgi:hypothetical protein
VFLSGDGIIQVALMRVEGAVKAAYGTPNPDICPAGWRREPSRPGFDAYFSPEISS